MYRFDKDMDMHCALAPFVDHDTPLLSELMKPAGINMRTTNKSTSPHYQGDTKVSRPGMPLISVITVVYNGENDLEETILSVLNQTYENVQYIVVDGGSTDRTLDIIRKYEGQIDCWVSESDNGIYDAMNKGLALASGEWINFMNAGDIFWRPNSISGVFGGGIDLQGSDLIYSDTMLDRKSRLHCSIERNRIIHQSLIYRKRLHIDAGLYVVRNNFILADYLFFMINKGRVWTKSDSIIAAYDTTGTSERALKRHIVQRMGIDLMFGNRNVHSAYLFYLLYPIYHWVKKTYHWVESKITAGMTINPIDEDTGP